MRVKALRLNLLTAFLWGTGCLLVHAGESSLFTWENFSGYRRAELTVAPSEKVGFTLQPADRTGVQFTNVLTASRYTTNQIYLNGSGVAAGDVDGDGWCDLYFASIDGPNRLFRNRGNWEFEDVTEAAGVACEGLASTGVLLGDLDGDADLDLIVNSIGQGTRLFFNDGQGHFTPRSQGGALNPNRGGTSLAMADIDGDGDLDLYVANYRTDTITDRLNVKYTGKIIDGREVITHVDGEPVSKPEYEGRFTMGPNGRVIEHGEADAIFLNDGKGSFSPLSFTGGAFRDERGNPLTSPPYDWGLSVMFHDVNDDRRPDIYVCNDFASPDRFWINFGQGRFQAAFPTTLRAMSHFSMGVDFADINRDGRDDFFVADMKSRTHLGRQTHMTEAPVEGVPTQYSRNTLFLKREDETYAEIGMFSGVDASEWSWAPIFLDVDLDGYEDLLISNGDEVYSLDRDATAKIENLRRTNRMSVLEQLRLNRLYPRLRPRNVAFRNRGDLTFQEVGDEWGFTQPTVTHGMVLADLDNDGDLDLVCNNMNDPAGLYRNESAAPRVAVRLNGLPPNTYGIGAKVRVTGGPVAQSREIIAGGRYLSSDQPMRVFAAGSPSSDLTIEVLWRGGERSLVEHAVANHLYEIDESGAEPFSPPKRPAILPWFQDVSRSLNHRHHDDPFDDFQRQPLLPRKLSGLGPGVCWFDLDADGWTDLIVGSGRGATPAVFINQGNGHFLKNEDAPLAVPVARDQTAVVAFQENSFIAGSSTYEDPRPGQSAIQTYHLGNGRIEERELEWNSSAGPMSLADIDADGDLDLFVGGRVVASRYPEPASSKILLNAGGTWKEDVANNEPLKQAGLVSGSMWSDLNNDGFPELILACEWGPIRVFENRKGALREATAQWGLEGYRGWWNSVASGDFNNDGQMDLLAGNWGKNNPYFHEGVVGLKLYFGDFNGVGNVDLIEVFTERASGEIYPFRTLMSMVGAIPFVRTRIQSFRQYGESNVEEILGPVFQRSNVLTVDTLSSTLFLNRGGRFDAVELPVETQWAPVFGICVADADGDGFEDAFLAQNFSMNQAEMPAFNAGRGVWLRGDGAGGLAPLTGEQSGVRVYGDARGAAVGDFDRDGRIDLVAGQNGSTTRLFRNIRAEPGLRVRLNAGPGNPYGVGAMIRFKRGDRFGPAREIHGGAGYWSQDDPVQVLVKENGDQAWVRWPGGNETVYQIPEGAREIVIRLSQGVTVVE